MDRGQFDSLARLVSTKRSRRTALATLLGATLLRHHPAAVLGKGRGKVKSQAKAKAKVCYPGTRCSPGRGKNTSGCDFTSSTAFFEGDFRGANLSKSNFTGAQLARSDFRGANLSGACLVGANLLDAKLGSSVNLGGAIFCRTMMPDGSINDQDCDKGTACCPTPPPICEGETCGPEDCASGIDAICSVFGLPCCPDFVCTPSIIPVITQCEWRCSSDADCLILDSSGSLICAPNAGSCLFIGDCCFYRRCSSDADCPGGRKCCGAGGSEPGECHFPPCP